MASAHPSPHRHEHHAKASLVSLHRSEDKHDDVSALIEENAQLRELVIQLSKLVLKNVVDRK
jgi:hypothetical protein